MLKDVEIVDVEYGDIESKGKSLFLYKVSFEAGPSLIVTSYVPILFEDEKTPVTKMSELLLVMDEIQKVGDETGVEFGVSAYVPYSIVDKAMVAANSAQNAIMLYLQNIEAKRITAAHSAIMAYVRAAVKAGELEDAE